MCARARIRRMAKSICRSIKARALAVPNTNDPVMCCVWLEAGDLAAHDRSRAKFFVDAGLMHDLNIKILERPSQLKVETSKWRPLVPRDECGGSKSFPLVLTQCLE